MHCPWSNALILFWGSHIRINADDWFNHKFDPKFNAFPAIECIDFPKVNALYAIECIDFMFFLGQISPTALILSSREILTANCIDFID